MEPHHMCHRLNGLDGSALSEAHSVCRTHNSTKRGIETVQREIIITRRDQVETDQCQSRQITGVQDPVKHWK